MRKKEYLGGRLPLNAGELTTLINMQTMRTINWGNYCSIMSPLLSFARGGDCYCYFEVHKDFHRRCWEFNIIETTSTYSRHWKSIPVIRNMLLRNSTQVSFMLAGVLLSIKGVLHLWALFLNTMCIFLKHKATLDKVSYGSGQKYSKELKNHSFTSVETIVVKLQWKMCENQYFPCFEP